MKYDKVEYQVVREIMESRCHIMAVEPYTGCTSCELAFQRFQETLIDCDVQYPTPIPISSLLEIRRLRIRRYGW